MIPLKTLLSSAATLPPQRARIMLAAIAAKEKEEPKVDAFEAALEAMALAMEERIVKELESLFTE
jgi:hypothetical protein